MTCPKSPNADRNSAFVLNTDMLGFLKNLPGPKDFPEGQRQLFGWAMVGAGIAMGLAAMAITAWFMFAAHWFPDQRLTIIHILGIDLGLTIIGSYSVIVGLIIGGPVGRWGLSATKDGFTLNAVGDGEPPFEPTVTITSAQEVISDE